MKRLIGILMLIMASATANARDVSVCEVSESRWVNSLGDAAIGSSVTAYIAGELVVWKLTSAGWMAVAAVPAVPAALTGAAITASTLYVGLKGYCAYDDVVADVSIIIEKTADLPSPREVATDALCELFGNCPTYDPFN